MLRKFNILFLIIIGLTLSSMIGCSFVSILFSPSSPAISSNPRNYSCNQSQNAKEIIKQYRKGKKDFKNSKLRRDCLKYEALTDIDLSRSDLYQVNLEGVQIYYSNFNNSNLYWANLFNVKALYSDFTSTNLYQAILCNGLFCYSDFSYSDLSKADLRYADFSNAKLRKAKLQYSNLNGTNFKNANLNETDLRNAINLEQAVYLEDAIYENTIVTEKEYNIIVNKIYESKRIIINNKSQKLFQIIPYQK